MLPASPTLAMKWAKASGKRDVKPPPYARVCSEHFSPECYQRDLQHELLGLPLRKKLKPDAVPDRNLSQIKIKSKLHVLKNKEHVSVVKNNNKVNRLPMRSSIRIAKKKSIISVNNAYVDNVGTEMTGDETPEQVSNKLKFMAKLQLQKEYGGDAISLCSELPKYPEEDDTKR
ncbi:hypothetical protein NQ315_014356 [Exocentrus adspersus]|uniref:THAP-type domain-containing protein n=1 Tax=Exocentrus adspersus TaxID=1586481 RepID=A0AAV8V9P5_9CUCU|nr:hypothetical protein NQ315_014356 [Exocentrus adspersus]